MVPMSPVMASPTLPTLLLVLLLSLLVLLLLLLLVLLLLLLLLLLLGVRLHRASAALPQASIFLSRLSLRRRLLLRGCSRRCSCIC